MKILRAVLMVVLLAVALAGVGVWWLLFTQSGRDFLVAEVNGYTAKLETPVVLGKLEGNVLRDARLASLTVADRDGVWLNLGSIRLVWHPLALWQEVPAFEVLEVAKIEVSRLPVSEEEKAESGGALNPLDYLVYVPRTVRLEDVVVEAPVGGQRQRLRAEMVNAGTVQEVSVSTLEGPVTAVSGTVTVGGVNEGALDLSLREAPKGVIGALAKLPLGITGRLVGGIKGEEITLENLNVLTGKTQVVATGAGLRDGSKVAVKASAAAGDLRELKGLLGMEIPGAINITAEVSGTFAALGGTVSATLVRPGERAVVLVTGAGVVSPLTVTADVTGSWVKGKNTFTLAGGLELDPVQARLRGLRIVGPGTEVSGSGVVDLTKMLAVGDAVVKVQDFRPLAALAGVEVKGGMDAVVHATVTDGLQLGDAQVNRFEVVYQDYKAKLKQPARLAWDGKAGSLTPFELEIAGGSITAQGRMNAQTVDGTLVVKNVDIATLSDSDVMTGKVNLSATVGGQSAAPVITVAGNVAGSTGGYPVTAKLVGDWRGGAVELGGGWGFGWGKSESGFGDWWRP